MDKEAPMPTKKAKTDRGPPVGAAVAAGSAEVKPEPPQVDTAPNGKVNGGLSLREAARRQEQRREAHSVKEVEQILGIGHSTLYSLFNTGALKARRLLGRTVVLDSDLQEFLANLPSAFGPAA
jgi:hypothetical protein